MVIAMHRKKLSQSDLAEEGLISRQIISKAINGEEGDVGEEKLRQIEDRLGINIKIN